MRLKSYFSGTVEAAMALAREELGPEAMLVQSKRTVTTEAKQLGRYEVVFALEEQEPSTPAPVSRPAPPVAQAAVPARAPAQVAVPPAAVPPAAVPPAAARPAPAPAPVPFSQVLASDREFAVYKLSVELEALKTRIEGMSGAMSGREPIFVPAYDPRPANPWRENLIERDIEPSIADSIGSAAGGDPADPAALRRALEGLLRVDATLGAPGAARRIVALVGPPGAGKTTTLVKLATRYGLSARRSMHLLSTDVYRVGAAEQLRLYASILGVGFQTIETPLALAQALEEQRRKDLILIDTPGWAQQDLAEIGDLAKYIAEDPDIDVHLVLPASNRGSDLARMVDRYAIFQPDKLLFTRIDETARHGPLVNESQRTGKPVSFLTTGQQIPEDLEPATAARIADLILGRTAAPEQAVLLREESI